MLDYLKPISNQKYDTILFLPGDKQDTLHIEVSEYQNPGEKIGGSSCGEEYHIITFTTDSEGEICDREIFDAILIEPFEYISQLIPQNYYGIISKKTTTSTNILQKTFDILAS